MMREVLYWQEACLRLEALTVYRGVLKDGIMKAFLELCRVMGYEPQSLELTNKYYEFLTKLIKQAEKLHLKGNIMRKYLIHMFLNSENAFSLACERGEVNEASTLYQLAAKDIATLHFLCGVDIKNICDNIGGKENIIEYMPLSDREDPFLEKLESDKTPAEKLISVIWRYEHMGAGIFAAFNAFEIGADGGLSGLVNVEPVAFKDLVGLDVQKEAITGNIENFIAGRQAEDMLLTGAAGTGRLSCVMAALGAYADHGLRLVYVDKERLPALSGVIRGLSRRGCYFIIYLDNCADSNGRYDFIESTLCGGIQHKPKHVMFAAACGRGEDANGYFGLTVKFPELSSGEFLTVVNNMADKKGLLIDKSFLDEQALLWADAGRDMTGGTAKRFVEHILSEINKG